MKIKYITTVLLAAALGFSSCKDFLEETNKSGLTEDPFYKTELGITSAVNASYSGTRLWYGKEAPFGITETGTDLFLRGGDNKANQLSDYTIDLNGAQTNLKDYWAHLYRALNATNTAIALLPSPLLTDALNKQYMGEVKFLRALYLSLIVETWGGVVLNTEPTAGAVTTAKRSSEEEFYKVIFSDLDAAIENLAAKKSTDGRITQDVAKAFKARMALTRASQTDNAGLYAEAATLAKDVISNGRYTLFSDYGSLWDMKNSEGGTNSEVVYFVNYTGDDTMNGDYDASAGKGNSGHLYFIMVYDKQPGMIRSIDYGRPYQRYLPSRHLLNLFDETKDQRYHGSFQTVWKANDPSKSAPGGVSGYPQMVVGDTSMLFLKTPATAAQTARAKDRYKIFDVNTMYRPDGSPLLRSQFIQLKKFMDPTRLTANQEWSSRDAFVIRIAELYLIAAEAMLKTNPGEALQYINTLRTKRALPGKEVEMQVTQEQLNIDFILEERARELAGEQIRWFDLKRTGKLVEYVQKYNPDAKDNIKAHHRLRPISQVQLDAVTNKEEFIQNEGYN
ncbi:RagB/SusD family nutrient uptake outer membrane protein [Pontibacter qinzhouensis]|uniref:RagB/SusD family nutrient uptake outer membrane protein n=1 Tax=Pontibacter qinzhouensis TaxID=2603253 RepID=A0A5C8KDE5_9BACT|nr:RagB/SusD family nutrient uptake outer membrane protein [Pontibacter qinzhouensis]TXK52601.1 RagB/SusD family nutrient uptake outer membrane protein [Pontibacter qinzhouensis]